jgi:hypothetical protein
MVKVQNITSERSGEAVRNQFIIKVGNATYFQSYETMIAKTEPGKTTLIRGAWDYSCTTSKYLYQFLRDYCGYWNICSKKDILKAVKDGEFEIVDKID